MTMIRVPAPASVHGDQLTAELDAAGIPDATVTLVGDHLEIAADATKAAVERVVNAHTPAAAPAPVKPLTDDEITRLRALLTSR